MLFKPNACQRAAVAEFIKFLQNPDQPEMVLEGYGGTGKTTLIKYLLDSFTRFQTASEAIGAQFYCCDDIAVTATTRKAAHVIAQTLNTEPQTIHSYLGLILKNNFKTGTTSLIPNKHAKPKENTLIFIDEASFIDEQLLKRIREFTPKCKIVYMGDPCQLISVNASESPIFNGSIPTVKLKTIMRNDGAIAELSGRYRNTVEDGVFKPILTDNQKVVHVTGDVFQSMIDSAFTAPDFEADKSAKILAWTNERVQAYNTYVSEMLGYSDYLNVNASMICNNTIVRDDKILITTDKRVVITEIEPEQEYDVDGYTVRLKSIGKVFVPDDYRDTAAVLRHFARHKMWKEYFHVKNTWADLRPPFAATVHKSQGSTYDRVFIDLSDIGKNTNPEEVARLLYVAVSRASEQVILYGELPEEYAGVTHADLTPIL